MVFEVVWRKQEMSECEYSRIIQDGGHYRMCDLFLWQGCGETGWHDNFLKCDMRKLATKILAERADTKTDKVLEPQLWQPKWKNQP